MISLLWGKRKSKNRRPDNRKKNNCYSTWTEMRRRCFTESSKNYKYYGGRGISICAEWDDFSIFYRDMGERPSRYHSIERKNTNKDYSKKNCIWATQTQQCRNRRLFKSNKLGLKGVSWNGGRCNKFQARITVNKKVLNLGFFEDAWKAALAYNRAAKKYFGPTAILNRKGN